MSTNFRTNIRSLKEDEIRLIKILPGNWEDEIQCEQVYDSLRTIHPYHALSYCWGSPRITRRISMDGQATFVTVNLESALRHLRSRLQGSYLWVDALCINQADNEERTHQVKLMGDIYRSSMSVLVYLGDGVGRDGRGSRRKVDEISPPITTFSDDYDKTYLPMVEPVIHFRNPRSLDCAKSTTRMRSRTMQDTLQVFSLIRTLCHIPHLTEVPPSSSEYNILDNSSDSIRVVENLRQLMHAPFTPWWGRIWVVQEVVLPPKITVICGTVSAPWTMFANAASQSLHHLRHCCSDHAKNLPRDVLNVLKDFCHRVQDIEDLRSTTATSQDVIRAITSPLTNPGAETHKSEPRSLISLLRRFRGRKASDPRDKVYALLSLVKSDSDRPPLYPDYSLSDTDVYINAALESIYCSTSLSVLGLDLVRKCRQDLPSWVPDWEAPGDFSHDARMEATELYNACNHYPINPSTVNVRGRMLAMEGKLIASVEYHEEMMLSESPESIRQVLSNWTQGRDNFTIFKGQLSWRVLLADVVHGPQAASTKESFRRAEPGDELIFVTWALLSKLSPFEYKSLHQIFDLSPMAMFWSEFILFENAVAAADIRIAAFSLQRMFLDMSERKHLILRAYRSTSNFREEENHERGLIESIENTAKLLEEERNRSWNEHLGSMKVNSCPHTVWDKLFEYQFFRNQLADRELQAWSHVPLGDLLQIVRSQLLERSAEAPQIELLPYDTQISILDNSIISATKARRLFVTIDGDVGLGPADLVKGDRIYLLKGGKTPFVLREEGEKSQTQMNPLFKVVGDCYLSGLMDLKEIEALLGEPHESWKDWQWVNLD